MLLAQVDMFLLETITDVIAIYFVTRWYIKNRAIDNLIIADAVAATSATDASVSSALVGYVAPASASANANANSS